MSASEDRPADAEHVAAQDLDAGDVVAQDVDAQDGVAQDVDADDVQAPPAVERTAPVARPETGFTDTLTLAFADPDAAVFGVIELEHGATGSVGALVFADGEQVAAHTRADLPTDLPHWQALSTDALTIEVDPAEWSWVIECRVGDVKLTAEFLPLGDAFIYEAEGGPGSASGLGRSERLCRVTGSATVAGTERALDARGQRSHQWGSPPFPALDGWRSVAVWLEDGRALALWSARPAGAAEHGSDAVAALVYEGDPPRPHAVADPRMSTTYDADGVPLRAGLELWVGPDDAGALRAAGERICGGTLEVGAGRQQWTFLDWHMDGAAGPGALAVVTPRGDEPPA